MALNNLVYRDQLSVVAQWHWTGYPGIEQDELKIEEYDSIIALPGAPRLIYHEGRPRVRNQSEYELELTKAREIVWKSKDDESLLSSTALADKLVIQFFTLADRIVAERARSRR